jgi:hypothetical protein
MRDRGLSAMVFVLVLVAACAVNRQAMPASLPAPLVAALVNDRGSPTSASPEFTVGTLPLGYPAALVPSDPARVVGGMRSGDQITAIFSDSTRRLAATFEQLFESAGYSRPRPSPGSGFSSASGPYSYFCNDSAMVSVEPLTGSERHFARVTYRRVRDFSFCRRVDPPRSAHQLQLPALMPPAGVRVARSNGSGGVDDVASNAAMTGRALMPSAMLAHYATQLVAAGWTAAAPAVSERVAAQFFEAKDDSGAPWEGVLMAAGSGTAMTISLSMHPRTKP